MPLIRNKQAGHLTPRAVALELDDVRAEARELLESARAEASALVVAARATAAEERAAILEAARVEGERAGFEQGLEAGRSEGMQKVLEESLEPHKELLNALAPAWVTEFERYGHERERLMEDARRQVLSFALEIAKCVVHRTIEQDDQVCVDQVREAIGLIGRPTQLRIAICPDDRVVIEHALPGVLQAAGLACDVDVVEDPELARGGCVLSTPEGEVDATIQTKIERIAGALVPGADA